MRRVAHPLGPFWPAILPVGLPVGLLVGPLVCLLA